MKWNLGQLYNWCRYKVLSEVTVQLFDENYSYILSKSTTDTSYKVISELNVQLFDEWVTVLSDVNL